MRVDFKHHETGDIILTIASKDLFLPRRGENVFIDDYLYDVYKVHHFYSTDIVNPIRVEVDLIPQ